MLGINPLEIGTGLSYINKIKLFSVPFVANIIHRPFYNYHLFSRGFELYFKLLYQCFCLGRTALDYKGTIG